MRILHVMLSKGKGGLEQAFQHYTQALLRLSHTVQCVVDPANQALCAPALASSISNLGPWDMVASWKLRKMTSEFSPDLIIAHAHRAIRLVSRFAIKNIPIIGVLHNATAQHTLPCDAIITVAWHIKKSLEARGLTKGPIYVLPNMVITERRPEGPTWQSSTNSEANTGLPRPAKNAGLAMTDILIKGERLLTIGVLARLDPIKGIDLFLESLALLKNKVGFKAIIAGDGLERAALERQAVALDLSDVVRFVGWIEDKTSFFNEIDIFCLPSRREGLPVSLLEAFAYQKPVVATATEGAKEVCSHGEDAYLSGFEPVDMAFCLGSLLQDPALREKFSKNAFQKVQTHYSQSVFTQNLGCILNALPSFFEAFSGEIPPNPPFSKGGTKKRSFLVSPFFKRGTKKRSFLVFPFFKRGTKKQSFLVPPFEKGGLGGILARFIKKHFYINRWNIGLIRAPITNSLTGTIDQQAVHWLPIPKGHRFMADPFVVVEQGQLFLFYELLDYRNKIGKIHYARLNPVDFSIQETGEALSSSKHLSYPYVFKEGNHFYMIPESSAAGEVSLYVAESFPRQWKKIHTLFHVGGIDNTIVFYDNKWWLFFTLSHYPGQALQELHVAFCDTLTGTWQLHPKNPVKTDRASARPAGTPFVYQGNLFRPAQDCSGGYGGGMTLNQITQLSESEFCEIKKGTIRPLAPFPDGLHTLSAGGNILTAIDGLRLEFAPFKFMSTWQRRWFRFLRWLMK